MFSPHVALLAAQHLTGVTTDAAVSNQHEHAPAVDETGQAANQHAANLAKVVWVLVKGCWGRVLEEGRLQARHWQAILDAFLCPCLGLLDSPDGLR